MERGSPLMERGVRAVALILALVVVPLIALGVLLTAGDDSDDVVIARQEPTGGRWQTVRVDPEAPFLPTLANAEFAVGQNRLSFTVVGEQGTSLAGLQVRVRLFDLGDLESNPEPATSSTQFARFISYADVGPVPRIHRHAGGASLSDNARFVGAGVYVVPAFFPAAGRWGLEFRIDDGMPGSDGEDARPVEILFQLEVRERASAPNVGEPAIAVRTRTLADEPDVARLTSDLTPEPGLYQLSIDEALAAPRPLVLIFSTPAFCHSRTCGPALEVVKNVWRSNAGELDAIHVEVFENPDEPDSLREASAFEAWRLPSEPWVFVIDRDGRIFSRYEGTITEPELRGDVAVVLGS